MRSKKSISAAAAFCMLISAFSGIYAVRAEDNEIFYDFSELTEQYNKTGASVFDGALTVSGTETVKPLSVNTAVLSPAGTAYNITSALITKQLAVTLHLEAGETVVEYYCGSDSSGGSAKAIELAVKDAEGNVVSAEANAENSGVKPYIIYYTAEAAGDYTIAETSTGTTRTIVYAVAVTDGTFTPPSTDVTPAPSDPDATPTPVDPHTTLAPVDPDTTPTPTPAPRPTVDPDTVPTITLGRAVGWLESSYVIWTSETAVSGFHVYVKSEDGEYIKLDDELTRCYGDYYRADAMGLPAGNYQMKVVPVINGAEIAAAAKETAVFEVLAQVREGFAFDPRSPYYQTEGLGGYKYNGEIRDGAQIIYIDNNNVNTVTLDVITSSKGTSETRTGLVNILAGREKGYDTRPLIIRMIGQVIDVEGLNTSDYIQLKGTTNVTIEGVGDDSGTYGWSFLVRDTKNCEIRNLAVMEFYDDGISLDTDNFNDWVHNCDIFYGEDRGGDQKKGDGSLDIKSGSSYCTFSYNHFWDSGKTSLCGMTYDSDEFFVTYCHNWFDHSDSRHPRIRSGTVHVYNNYYDGNSKYGVGITNGGNAFVENNVFRNCLYPVLASGQGTDAQGDGTFSGDDGGIIKMYGNIIYGGIAPIYASETNTNDFDAYLALSRDEIVPEIYTAKQGGTAYNNFDTDEGMYEYTALDADEVVVDVETYAGRIEGGDFEYEFDDAVDDTDYSRNAVLGGMLENYLSSILLTYTSDEIYPATNENGTLPTAKPTAVPLDPTVQPTPKPANDPTGSTGSNAVIWKASDTGVSVTAGTVLMEGWLTLAGADAAYSATNHAIGGISLTGKLVGSGNSPSLTNPENGAVLRFTPPEDGLIAVYFKLNDGKTFYITDDAGMIIAEHTNGTGASEYTILSAEVEAGKVYYAFGGGTNSEFWAASYESAEPSENTCVKISATYRMGVLTELEFTYDVPVTEAVPEYEIISDEFSKKIMYWESIESMKPVNAS